MLIDSKDTSVSSSAKAKPRPQGLLVFQYVGGKREDPAWLPVR